MSTDHEKQAYITSPDGNGPMISGIPKQRDGEASDTYRAPSPDESTEANADAHEPINKQNAPDDGEMPWLAQLPLKADKKLHPSRPYVIAGAAITTVTALITAGVLHYGQKSSEASGTDVLGTHPTPVASGTNNANPATKDTLNSEQGSILVQSTQASESSTTSAPISNTTGFNLIPPPDADETPSALRKYLVNQDQEASNPDDYWKAYTESIGMQQIPLNDSEQAEFKEFTNGNETIDTAKFGALLNSKLGALLTAYAMASANNYDISPDVKANLREATAAYFTDQVDGLTRAPEHFPVISGLDQALTHVFAGMPIEVQIVQASPSNESTPGWLGLKITTFGDTNVVAQTPGLDYTKVSLEYIDSLPIGQNSSNVIVMR